MTIKNLILDVVKEESGLGAEEIAEVVRRKNPEYRLESIFRELRRLNGKYIMKAGSRYYMNYSLDEKQKKVEEWL